MSPDSVIFWRGLGMCLAGSVIGGAIWNGAIWLDCRRKLRRLKQEAAKPKLPLDSVLVFNNGMIAAFAKGEQVPALQIAPLYLWALHAEREGYDPTSCRIETPQGELVLVMDEEGRFRMESVRE